MSTADTTTGSIDVESLQPATTATLTQFARQPVHAYLLIGPKGRGTEDLAAVLAAELLAGANDAAEAQRHRTLARSGHHPAVTVYRRVGAALDAQQLRDAARQAAMVPPDGRLQVIVLTEFHLVGNSAAMILKTLEEPPEGTVFIVTADEVTAEMATVASRCVRVNVAPIPHADVVGALMNSGVAAEDAEAAAAVADGDLLLARLLAGDIDTVDRNRRWRSLATDPPTTPAEALACTRDLLADVTTALEHVESQHAAEVTEAEEQAEKYGTAADTKSLLERQKRERRRLRGDMVAFGIATVIAELRSGTSVPHRRRFVAAADAATTWQQARTFNAREDLALLRFALALNVS